MELTRYSISIPKNNDVELALINETAKLRDIYSYVVRDDEDSYRVDISVSDIDEYNTIRPDAMITEIVQGIANRDSNLIICFHQPTIDILIDVYEPLINKLAREQAQHWQQLNYEDLCQTCRYCICLLYSKGYYIHKGIIARAFNNEVLGSLRKTRGKRQILSIDAAIGEDEDSEKITIGDIIPDNTTVEEINAAINAVANQQMWECIKAEVIKIIGPRQWDQLFREYKNGLTTPATQQRMLYVRDTLKSKGLTLRYFMEKFGG